MKKIKTQTKVPVTRLWHKKGKLEYFSILQLISYFPNIDFEFHIVLDQFDYQDEWSYSMESLPCIFKWYSKEDMHSYLIECEYGNEELISKIPNFVHFYHILINHYVRRTLRYDYAISMEYDVLFNSENLEELNNCLENHIPFGIIEPANPNCDKAMYQILSNMFNTNIIRYPEYGFNAGFQGFDLKIYDEFLSPSNFNMLLNNFDFEGIYDKDGKEKTGWERTLIDTQEQSFQSLMNALSPNFHILNPNEYYVFPYWVDLPHLLKSKVIHFIGHEKPQVMMDMINEKLKTI